MAHPCYSKYQNFIFLKLNNIPLYACTSLFTHLSVGKCLGCFNLLTIVTSTFINIGVQVYDLILVLSSFMHMPKVELLGYMINL